MPVIDNPYSPLDLQEPTALSFTFLDGTNFTFLDDTDFEYMQE